MEWTSAEPQVKLSLLNSISCKIPDLIRVMQYECMVCKKNYVCVHNLLEYLFPCSSCLGLCNFLSAMSSVCNPCLFCFSVVVCSHIHSPWLGDKVDSGIGLSYRPASQCSPAGRYIIRYPMPESTFFPLVSDYEFGHWSVLSLSCSFQPTGRQLPPLSSFCTG